MNDSAAPARLACVVFGLMAVICFVRTAARPQAGPVDWDRVLPAHVVDLRDAPEHEIRALPGVGPVLASRIVEERARAPFAAPSDLLRVHGVGPVLVSRLLPHVTCGPRPP